MAHPKLATVVGRSLLTATAAALMVGPLAAAGAAQTLDGVTDALKLTCEEAFETEKEALIDEFCTDAELEALTSPLDKSVDEVTETVDKTVTEVAPTAAPDDGAPEEEPGTGGGIIPEDETGGSPAPGGNGGTDVGSTGGSGFEGVDEGGATAGGTRNGRDRTPARAGASSTRESNGYGYNADGPFRPGMQSNSSLTLQPFAAPLVSVPPIYELPQIAQQLFGSDSAATAEDPMVAGSTSATQASPYSPTGYSATSADPTGWLAATATGLIMLVGAGHAINGGRTPKQHRA